MKALAAFLVALGVAACQAPESERVPDVFEIAPSTTSPTALQSSIIVQVRCDLHWTVELLDSSWGSVKVDHVIEGGGGTFIFDMGVNTSEDRRENTVILKAGKSELRRTITQGGVATAFSPRALELSRMKERSIAFIAPTAWTAKVTDGADWLEVKTPSGAEGNAEVMVVAKDPNENVGPRTGVVRIGVAGHEFDIPVTQNQTDVILSQNTTVEFPFEKQSFTVDARYNVDYEIEISAPWITHVKAKAPLHESVESFVVEENTSEMPRHAEIAFVGGKADPLVVTVSQGGKDPFLNITTPGFYGINNIDIILGIDGWKQQSRLALPDGSVRYRMFKGSNFSVAELSGMRQDVETGQNLSLTVTVSVKGQQIITENHFPVVFYQKDGLIWLRENEYTYFVLNK